MAGPGGGHISGHVFLGGCTPHRAASDLEEDNSLLLIPLIASRYHIVRPWDCHHLSLVRPDNAVLSLHRYTGGSQPAQLQPVQPDHMHMGFQSSSSLHNSFSSKESGMWVTFIKTLETHWTSILYPPIPDLYCPIFLRDTTLFGPVTPPINMLGSHLGLSQLWRFLCTRKSY